MNKDTRKELGAIHTAVSEAHSALEGVRDSEQEKFDNLPESIQQGDQGQKLEAAISNLEDAIEALDTAMSAIDSAGE